MEEIRKELKDYMKDELIRLLGTAIIGSKAAGSQWNKGNTMREEETEEETSYAAEAAVRWG